MEKEGYGTLSIDGIEVVVRGNRYFLRYDAGAHMVVWREDEISASELDAIKKGGIDERQAMLDIQKRLLRDGIDPYQSNWQPNNA